MELEFHFPVAGGRDCVDAEPMSPKPQTSGAGPRFVKLLQAIAEGDRAFSLKDLSARLGLPQSTVHRLLQPLVAADLIARVDERGYRMGPELFRLASLTLAKFDIAGAARPILHALWSQYRESCSLCLYMAASRSGVVVETLRTPHPLQYVIEPHTPVSLAWGSLGRAILAFLDEAVIEQVIEAAPPGQISGLPPPTPAELAAELKGVRAAGYAIYEDKRFPDLAGVAAPVFGPDGQVAASIGVTMPGARFAGVDKRGLARNVAAQASRLSAAIGYAKPQEERLRGA